MDKNLIKRIVQAIEIQEGQLIALQFWGEDKNRALLHAFSEEIAAIGGIPLELQYSRKNISALFKKVNTNIYNEKYYSIFKEVDVVIDLCMYAPVLPGEDFPQDKKVMYKEYMGNLFRILQEKAKFIQLRVPTAENAVNSSLSETEFVHRMHKAYDIDYQGLKKEAVCLVDSFKGREEIQIRTEKNSLLKLNVQGRNWHTDTGTGDMPCGEVYVAPVEERTQGNIYFPKVYLDGMLYCEVTLTIQAGVITACDNAEFLAVIRELPDGGDRIGEFGIGLNQNVEELCGYTVLDEKMKDTFHLGLGNNVMFGGKNESQCHFDLVFRGDVSFS
jgi:leucyl aminopeptidase (aminopeptidase T)